jgi:hypothetical protein
MDLAADFSFQPLPAIPDDDDDDAGASAGVTPAVATATATAPTAAAPAKPNPLGLLAGLVGKWTGKGFNTIWRPDHVSGQDHFLELNVTSETLEFSAIPGAIPNRGLLQGDINMFGLTYLQQISDANLKAGLHIEPGLWVNIPKTANPNEAATVARLGSIPHGTTIVAQGTAISAAAGPAIPNIGITPFTIGQPGQPISFPEQTLATPSSFRSSGAQLTGITQAMVSDPNTVLHTAIAGQHITSTITLHVSTTDSPVPGGGTANTAFLKGGTAGPNAVSASATATFWLQTLQGQTTPTQLQYSQTVLLNFNGLSWPHVTVGTLKK